MPVRISDFGTKIALWAKNTKKNMTRYIQSTCNEFAEEIITTAPCDTGGYIGNWTPSINIAETSNDFVPGPSKYRRGGTIFVGAMTEVNRARAIAHVRKKLAVVIPQVHAHNVFYFTNGIRYARYVEYGGGNTRPYAVVRRAYHAVRRKIEQSATFGTGKGSQVKRGRRFE